MITLTKYTFRVALLCLVATSWAQAFENPIYVLGSKRPDRAPDTLAIVTYLSEPAYLKPFELEMAWIVGYEVKDSLRVYASAGQICNFEFDRRSHTWYGDFQPGDTLRCSFTLTPLVVGKSSVAFRVDLGPGTWIGVQVQFTLDETGALVPVEAKKLYGTLGLEPGHMGDTIYMFSYPCYEDRVGKADEKLTFKVMLSPVPGPDTYSDLTVVVRSVSDLEYGAYYYVGFNDVLDVQLPENTDWLRAVPSGEELVIRAKVRPVRSGIGSLTWHVAGYRPEHEPTIKGGIDRGGLIRESFGIYMAFDEDLRLLAYSRSLFLPEPGPGPRSVGRNDAYRMPAIEALTVGGERRVLYSASYDGRQKELFDQYNPQKRKDQERRD